MKILKEIIRVSKVVFWLFLGIRSEEGRQEDFEKIHFGYYVSGALIWVALFILFILALVKLATGFMH